MWKVLVILIFVFLFTSCEKYCDKIDGKRYDREKEEWVDLKEDSTKDKDK